MSHNIEIIEADLNRVAHQKDILELTAAYALDPMGNEGPLPDAVLEQLIPGLKNHPTTLIFIAYADEKAAGIATCFLGFATFHAKPLINIHDFAVLPEFRGVGISRQLLAAVEQKAHELGCCKLTLEVQENNRRARQVYEAAGFAQAVYGDTTGGSLFYQKPI